MTASMPPARSAKEQFDRQAAHYNAQWNSWTEATLHWLLAHADCQPDDTVLDVATGTGFTAMAFAPHVRSVVGLDVSPGMLAQAQQKAAAQNFTNITWTEGAAESIPFPEATFSLVTCRVAPHHFLSIADFLSEVRRVLVPGGRFLLADTCVPADDAVAAAWQNHVEALRDPSHVRNLSPQEWQQAIEHAGLTVQEREGPVGDIAMTLEDWMVKAGCTPSQAEKVRNAFATAPQEAIQAFQIRPVKGSEVEEEEGEGTKVEGTEDFAFVWQRVVAKAVRG